MGENHLIKNIGFAVSAAAIFFVAVLSFSASADAKVAVYVRNDKGEVIENGRGKLVGTHGSGRLHIGKYVTGIDDSSYSGIEGDITSVSVSKDNKYFVALDGVLYNKKMTNI